jgi:hypothetical protein
MPRLRFETTRDLLDAYPAASDELLIEPVDTPSLTFLAELSGQQPIDKAIGFLCVSPPAPRGGVVGLPVRPRAGAARQSGSRGACGLRKNGCGCRRRNSGSTRWPSDGKSNYRAATTWLALAAGWAGPSMPPGGLAGFEGASPPASDAWLVIPPDYTARQCAPAS